MAWSPCFYPCCSESAGFEMKVLKSFIKLYKWRSSRTCCTVLGKGISRTSSGLWRDIPGFIHEAPERFVVFSQNKCPQNLLCVPFNNNSIYACKSMWCCIPVCHKYVKVEIQMPRPWLRGYPSPLIFTSLPTWDRRTKPGCGLLQTLSTWCVVWRTSLCIPPTPNSSWREGKADWVLQNVENRTTHLSRRCFCLVSALTSVPYFISIYNIFMLASILPPFGEGKQQ